MKPEEIKQNVGAVVQWDDVKVAKLFHEIYERLAPAFGWRTKKGCNVAFELLPQRNRALMIATCQKVLKAIQVSGAAAKRPVQHGQPEIIIGCYRFVKHSSIPDILWMEKDSGEGMGLDVNDLWSQF